MKKFATLLLSMAFALAPIVSVQAATSFSAVDETSGNGITVWDTFNGTDFEIQASVLVAGIWTTTPVTISNPVLNAQNPRAAVNTVGDIVVIWEGIDYTTGYLLLYGATYNAVLATWSAPTLISTGTESIVSDIYYVHLTTSSQVSVTWYAFQVPTSLNSVRAVYNTVLATWTTPITLS